MLEQPVHRIILSLNNKEAKAFEKILRDKKSTGSLPLKLFQYLRKTERGVDRQSLENGFRPKRSFQTALENLRDQLTSELPVISANLEAERIKKFNQNLDSVWELCDRGGFELANELFFKLFWELKTKWIPNPRNFFLFSRIFEVHSKLLNSGPWEKVKVSQTQQMWKEEVFMFAGTLAKAAGQTFTNGPKVIPKLEEHFQSSLFFQMMKNALETPEKLRLLTYPFDKPRIPLPKNGLTINESSLAVLDGIKYLSKLEGLCLAYSHGEKEYFDRFWNDLQNVAIFKKDLRLAEFAFFQLHLWDIKLRSNLNFALPDEILKTGSLASMAPIRWKGLIEDEISDIPIRIEFNKGVLHFCNGDFEKASRIFRELVRDKGTVKKIEKEFCDLYILICNAMEPGGKFDIHNWKDEWKKTQKGFIGKEFEMGCLSYLIYWVVEEKRKPKTQYNGPALPDPNGLSSFQYPLYYWLKNLHINNGYSAS